MVRVVHGVLSLRVVSLMLFVAAVVGVFLLMFVPPLTLSSEHSWDVERGEPVVTGLLRPSVEFVNVTGSCDLGSSTSNEVLESDNWLVSVRGQGLEVVSPLGGDSVLSVVLPGSCDFNVTYSLSEMSVAVTVVDDVSGVVISEVSAVVPEAFRVSTFDLSGVGNPVFEQVTVETFPWGLGFSPVRFVGQVLVFGAVGLLVVRTIVRNRASPSLSQAGQDFPLAGSRWPRWVIHGSVLVALVAGVMLFPSYFDDGWVFQRLEEAVRTGLKSILYAHDDVWLIQRLWLEGILSGLVSYGASFEVLRLLVVGVLWWGWWFLTRALELFGYLSRVSELVIAASVFVAFSLAHLMTIRPEPIVTVLAAVFFVGFMGFVHRRSESYLLMAGLAAVAAGTAQQSGFILLLPALLLLGIAFWQARLGRIRWDTALNPAAVGIIFGFGLVFLDFDVPSLVREVSLWTETSSHDGSRPEVQRWVMLSSEPGWRWWPLVIAGGAGLSVVAGWSRLDSPGRLLSLAVLATPLGLFFTASKWTWHLGALVLPTVLLVVLVVSVFRQSLGHRSDFRIALIPFLVGLTGAVTVVLSHEGILGWSYPYRKFWKGATGELLWHFDAEGLSFTVLVVAIPLLAVVVHLLRGRWRETLATGAVAFLMLLPVGNHYGMLVADSLVWPGWTPVKQRLMNLAGVENCGMLDELDVVVGADAVGTAAQEDGTNYFAGPFDLPTVELEGLDNTVSFELDGELGPTVLWAKGVEGSGNLTVEMRDSLGNQQEASTRWFHDRDTWQLFSLPSREKADGIVLTVSSNAEDSDEILVTMPATPEWQPAAEIVAGTTVLAGPSMSTYVSCASEPQKDQGRWIDIDHVVVTSDGIVRGSELVAGERVEIGFNFGIESFLSLVGIR